MEAAFLLGAIVSPSFVKSEWCRQEWTAFTDREQQLRKTGELAQEQGLILPVLLYPLDRGNYSASQKQFHSKITTRQWYDLSSRISGTPLRQAQIRELVETLIDVLSELQISKTKSIAASASQTSSAVILDEKLNLMWTGTLSSEEMNFPEAKRYVRSLKVGGYSNWRLPSVSELESLIIKEKVLENDPNASPFPLKEPFNAQRYGYLHSGTIVQGYEKEAANFIMNVRNAHIFNGMGQKCFVRAVRTA